MIPDYQDSKLRWVNLQGPLSLSGNDNGEASKLWEWVLKLSFCSEIWHAPQ